MEQSLSLLHLYVIHGFQDTVLEQSMSALSACHVRLMAALAVDNFHIPKDYLRGVRDYLPSASRLQAVV